MIRWPFILLALSSAAQAQDYRFGINLEQATAQAAQSGYQLKTIPGVAENYFLTTQGPNGLYEYSGGLSFCKNRLYARTWTLSGGFEGFARTTADLSARNGNGVLSARSEYINDGLLSSVEVLWSRPDGFEEKVSATTVTGSKSLSANMSLSRVLSARGAVCR